MYIKCMKCAYDKIKCTADLQGTVKGWINLRLETTLKVYLECPNCGFKVKMLDEAKGVHI